MPLSSTKRAKLRKDTRRVARHAREIADTGDRWFLSLAGGLGRLGGWARREADIAADSAVAAFATTVNVAKKLAGAAARPPARSERATHAAPVGPSSGSRERASGRVASGGLDLVAAVPASERECETRSVTDAPHEIHPSSARVPAGVVPVLQALGRTVASHSHRGYASLQQDQRFWTLIHLLQTLGRPDIGPPPEDAPEDRRPPPSAEDPPAAPAIAHPWREP